MDSKRFNQPIPKHKLDGLVSKVINLTNLFGYLFCIWMEGLKI